jgi:hypothetical protein
MLAPLDVGACPSGPGASNLQWGDHVHVILTVNRPSLTVTKVQSGDLVHVIARWHTSTRATRYSDLRLNRLVWSVGIQRVSRTRHVPLAKQGGIRSSVRRVLARRGFGPLNVITIMAVRTD